MSLEMSPCHSGLALPPVVNRERGDPIPCIPFPLMRGRGRFWKEGLTPLLDTPLLPVQDKMIIREGEW